MGANKRRKSDRAGRPAMPSPGRPSVARREHRQRFWRAIAEGASSEDAARVVGVSPPVGGRWFREGGGMPCKSCSAVRALPVVLRARRYCNLARTGALGFVRSHGGLVVVHRRSRANCAETPQPVVGDWSIELPRPSGTPSGVANVRRLPSLPRMTSCADTCKIDSPAPSPLLTERVSPAHRYGGTAGAVVRRQDRRWAQSWSPEQIANRLPVDFPEDDSMRISHEAIYQALYVQGRGVLRRELVACLRTGRALRVPRARTRGRGKKFVTTRGHDQRTSSRSTEPSDTRALGRRPDFGTGQLCHGDPG